MLTSTPGLVTPQGKNLDTPLNQQAKRERGLCVYTQLSRLNGKPPISSSKEPKLCQDNQPTTCIVSLRFNMSPTSSSLQKCHTHFSWKVKPCCQTGKTNRSDPGSPISKSILFFKTTTPIWAYHTGVSFLKVPLFVWLTGTRKGKTTLQLCVLGDV